MSDRLREFLSIPDDDPIVRRAVARGWVRRDRLDMCVLEAGERTSVRDVLIQRGYLTPAQVRALSRRRWLWLALAVPPLVLGGWLLLRRPGATPPSEAELRTEEGRSLSREGSIRRAEEAWRKALEADPRFGPAHFELGRLAAARSFWRARGGADLVKSLRAEAVRHLEAASPSDLRDALLAWLRDDAAAVRKLAQSRPDEADLQWVLGMATKGTEQRAAFDRALAACPAFPFASCSRGTARLDRGDLAGAEADLTDALRLAPELGDAWFLRGMVRLDRGDGPGAAADIERALAIAPLDSPARPQMERLLERAKKR